MLTYGLKLSIFVLSPPDSIRAVRPLRSFVRSSVRPGQIFLPRHLKNVLNTSDKTDSEYSLAATDDPIRF